MKRKLCLILCFLMCFNFTTIWAEEEIGEALSEKISFLNTIGVLSEYDNLTLPLGRNITRAEFADFTAKLLNFNEYNGNELYYNDISIEHWAYDAITQLTQRGYISGKETKMFYPDEYISPDEIYVIFAGILGYSDMAKANGGYPTGYRSFASSKKLFFGSDDTVTMEEMILFMYNALSVDMLVVDKITGEGGHYKVDEEINILSKYYDAYEDRGRVTAAGTASLYTDRKVSSLDEIMIDGITFNDNTGNGYDYLGRKVKYIYIDGDDENTVVWMENIERNELIVEVTPECSFDKNSFILHYVENGKGKQAKISQNVSMIYNGASYGNNIDEILSSGRYHLRLIETEGKGYDIAVVEQYYNIVSGSINTDISTVYDKNISGKSVCFDEEIWESVLIKDVNGESINIEDIETGNIISVYESKNNERLEMIVSYSTDSGIIDNIREKYGEQIITLDGKEYITKEKIDHINYKAGDEVKLYLDAYGMVSNVEIITTDIFSAIIMKGNYDESEEKCFIRLLNEFGEIKDYRLKNKVRIDGEKYENASVAFGELCPGENSNPKLILCRCNTEGEIVSIERANAKTSDNSLITSVSEGAYLYRRDSRNLGPKMLIDNSTIIFAVPSDIKNADKSLDTNQYKVIKEVNLVNDTTYTASAYKAKKKVGFEQYVVVKNFELSKSDDICIVVDRLSQKINEDDEIITCIEGMQGNSYVELNTIAEFSPVKQGIDKGDLIRIYKDDDGNVVSADLCFDYDSTARVIDKNFNAYFRIMTGYVHDKLYNAVKVGYESGSNYDESINLGCGAIVVYDSENKRVRQGSVADVRTYQESGEKCSTIVVQSRHAYPILTVIYN